jgi:ribonuclease BN (tRNA processing enzyme)
LIETGTSLILMDHGPGASHRFLQTGRRITEISHVFFSHLHYDHCADYPRLVLQRWDQGAGAIPELEVYGPPPIERMTELLFGSGGAFFPDIEARVKHQGSIDIYQMRGGKPPRKPPVPRVREVAPGDVVQGPDWTVRVAEAQHVQPYLQCLAFRIDTDEGSMCYSGDSGGTSERIVELASGCDVLIHMVHYLSGSEPTEIYRRVCGNHEDAACIAREAGVNTLVLSHTLEQIDQPGVRERIIAEMSSVFKGTIIWGEDLMEVPLKGSSPARME